ncbi:MAG TPA: T9SS type A sorting domain-containing protein [Saprospiraceae bacterium]|nr:T9SS type A sorting domain-containing protein [Saprospiraceae bacterium]
MKRLLKTTIWVIALIFSYEINASMVCPPDKHLKCDDDISDLYLTGKPTLFGSHSYLTPVYEDQFFTNACNVGHVVRKWYLDLNHNYQADPSEPTCYQNIYLSENNYGSIIVKFPKDIVVNCLEDIPYMKPEITSRPCDLIGVSYRDEVFELLGSSEEGCKKILRKFTVINWCDYTPNSPYGGSVWYGTQVIKVIDKEKPEFTGCKDVTIGFNEGCKARVTLTNNAIDPGNCTSDKMSWIVEVDLWGDTKIDYVYSNIGTGIFFLPLQKTGQEIKITLPELLGYGKHKVNWKVKDACGNLTGCSTNFTTMDNKPPTPYCVQNVSVAINGKDGTKLRVPASMFSLGALDNCTATPYIKYSFSPNPADSLRFYDCTNAGFQYLTVYAIDLMGNKDFCAVHMTVYDNGSCSNTLTAAGKVMQPSGKKVMAGSMTMQGNAGNFNVYGQINDGAYNFKDVAIYNDMKFIPSKTGLEDAQVDVLDYAYFKAYLAGDDTLSNYGLLAADINDDKKVNARDFLLLKDKLLKEKNSFGREDWRFIPSYVKEKDLSLQAYSPVYDAKKFNGFLDFTAFAKGDLSETRNEEAKPRSNMAPIFVVGKSVVVDGKTYFPVSLGKEINLQAAILKLNQNESQILNVNENFDWAGVGEYQCNLLLKETHLFSVDEVLFLLESTDLGNALISGELMDAASGQVYRLEQKLGFTNNLAQVAPNPVSDRLSIQAPVGSSYVVRSVEGKVMLSGAVIQNETIDVTQIVSGLYFVELVIGSKSEVHKLIIAR